MQFEKGKDFRFPDLGAELDQGKSGAVFRQELIQPGLAVKIVKEQALADRSLGYDLIGAGVAESAPGKYLQGAVYHIVLLGFL